MLRWLTCRLAEARWGLVQQLEAELHPLRYLFWEATRRCNLACRHCGSDCGRDEGQPGLPGPILLAALANLASAYDAQRIMLVVTGGEPLLRVDLELVLARAGAMGFRLGLVTNGMALEQRRAERLAAAGLDSVVVSLDGPEDCHDWLRRRPGAHGRACQALVDL
ncbi:MAG: radical SAM protein, partial [Deltaproteobacteria bacterium]|nr:radical SAM protein [Deltaproteobacteria bacterium]